jgi:hypothetical protein
LRDSAVAGCEPDSRVSRILRWSAAFQPGGSLRQSQLGASARQRQQLGVRLHPSGCRRLPTPPAVAGTEPSFGVGTGSKPIGDGQHAERRLRPRLHHGPQSHQGIGLTASVQLGMAAAGQIQLTVVKRPATRAVAHTAPLPPGPFLLIPADRSCCRGTPLPLSAPDLLRRFAYRSHRPAGCRARTHGGRNDSVLRSGPAFAQAAGLRRI